MPGIVRRMDIITASVVIILLVFLLGVWMTARGLHLATERNHKLSIENNTYLRVMNCVTSVSPTRRTPDYVKLCYSEAERHNQVKVDKFGDGRE